MPYAHYGETLAQTTADIVRVAPLLEADPTRSHLATLLGPGAARNALDCALWDAEAKLTGRPVHELAGLSPPHAMETCFTLSLDTAEKMAAVARDNAWRPLLKCKVGSESDLEKVAAIRAAAPKSRLVVDANEGWTIEQLGTLAPRLAQLGVELIEQPLKAGKDLDALRGRKFDGVVICADESMRGDLSALTAQAQCYQAINIKLDKTGGMTHAIAIAKRARELGLKLMVGCMVSSSLSMAPAVLLASSFNAEWVDLDGPLLLAKDREPGLVYEGSIVNPPTSALWG